MLTVNKSFISATIRAVNSKINKGKDNIALYSNYAMSVFNYNDAVSEGTEYDMGNWIEHTDRWIKNHLLCNTRKYTRGTIVMLDLGATNFGSEPSYLHPAVILAENTFFVLIVPASSRKYGKGYKDIIDATPSDGFRSNTGVQAKAYRWVSKSRIDCVVGKTSSRLLDEIDLSMLNEIPTHKKIVKQFEAKIKESERENDNLKEKLAKLENRLTSIEADDSI